MRINCYSSQFNLLLQSLYLLFQFASPLEATDNYISVVYYALINEVLVASLAHRQDWQRHIRHIHLVSIHQAQVRQRLIDMNLSYSRHEIRFPL